MGDDHAQADWIKASDDAFNAARNEQIEIIIESTVVGLATAAFLGALVWAGRRFVQSRASSYKHS